MPTTPTKPKDSDKEIPDDELETPRPPSPVKTMDERAPSGNNDMHPMGWTQLDRQVLPPFPAGMRGVPPYPFMPLPNHNNVPPTRAPAKKKKKPNKKKNGSDDDEDVKQEDMRFTEEEKLELMSILDQIIPVSQVDWEAVEHDYNEFFPERPRTITALRRFFNSCAKKKSPTGNPNIPKWIKMAKSIQEQIMNKSDAVVLELDDDASDTEGLLQLMNRQPNSELDEHSACNLQVRHKEKDATSGKTTIRITTKPAEGNADACAAKAKAAKKKSPAQSESGDILKVILMTDKLNREAAERHHQEEREREKKQEMRDRRREKKENKRLDIMLGFMTGIMAQYKKKSGKDCTAEAEFTWDTETDESGDGGGKSGKSSFNERKRRSSDDE